MPPKFSVIIPAYNVEIFLVEAVQSVLKQTIQDFEILIVNDVSTDNTASIMKQFDDPRIICFNHSVNRGGAATRNTGLVASKGEWIVFLDADDFFHPKKLETHLKYYESHPGVYITYNSRYQLQHSSNKIRDIYRPPAISSLRQFVLGYPFSPSDMIMHRGVFEHVGLFNDEYRNWGEEFEYYTRIALAGYHFIRVNGVLNYRRYHAGRKNKHLENIIRLNLQTLDNIYADPLCPSELYAIRTTAYLNYHVEVLCFAFVQGDYDLGMKFLKEIIKIDPSIIHENPNRVVDPVFNHLINDNSLNHEALLPIIFDCLSNDLKISHEDTAQKILLGYLLKGSYSALWGDYNASRIYFKRAKELNAKVDDIYLAWLASQLRIYIDELGSDIVDTQTKVLFQHLEDLGGKACVRRVQGLLAFNHAFADYQSGDFRGTLREAIQAMIYDRSFISNRGFLSITARSIVKSIFHGNYS